jgi:fumarate reductase subunit C
MSSSENVIAGVGLADRPRKSRWPARMDLAQSGTGLVLGLFMWGHMFFVSTILISKDAMWTVAKFFEGYFFTGGKTYPVLVSLVVATILAFVIVHAFLAMRKFPANYRQYRTFIAHRKLIDHGDTTLWWFQAVTGFALFFLAVVHLYQMMMHPGDIGPYQAGERIWSGGWGPLYIVMLLAVELHGGIGLYRLCVKWGWFEGGNPGESRKTLKTLKWVLTGFFLVLGIATFIAYAQIGSEIRNQKGAVYTPAWADQAAKEKAK